MGLERGVFYPLSGPGVAWNGLISITESLAEADVKARYIDGVKMNQRRSQGFFAGTIEAYTYPDSFHDDILTQRRPRSFGLSYRDRTRVHLVYNALISPGGHSYKHSEVDPFSWDFTAKPVTVPGAGRSAHIIIETATAYSWTLAALEDVLYGSESTDAHLPLPEEVFQIFEDNSILQIIDHGDGSWTAIGPDDVVQMLDETSFQISWPSAVYIDADSYTIHSL